MSGPAAWPRRLLWGLLAAALLAVAVAALLERLERRRVSDRGLPPRLGRIPDFALTNRDGQPVRRRDLDGAPWVADFIFTRCTASCPALSVRMAQLDRRLAAAPGLHLVSFSVDPSHDTPAVLARYAASFAASRRWLFLTGDPAEIAALSRDGFKLGIDMPLPAGGGVPAPAAAGAGSAPSAAVSAPAAAASAPAAAPGIVHSNRFVLIDGDGFIRRYYDGLDPSTPARLAADLAALAADQAPGAPAAGPGEGAAAKTALASAAAPPPPAAPQVVGAARPGRPVLFVGLDGGDWQLLDGYIAGGTMPNLAALVREGRSGVLTTLHPPLSPLVWTTMMTGVSPLAHRILDFTRFDPRSGQRVPIGSDERRVPAVWNMATMGGRSVAVFGLWATYPAEPVRGLLVSDRFSSFTSRDTAPPPGVVYPPSEEAWARRVLAETASQTGYEAVHAYLPWLARADYEPQANPPDAYAHPVSALRQILIETRAYRELAIEWLRRARPDLAVVYFQGTDTIGHVFAPYAPPRLPAVAEADFARYSAVPRLYFAEVDRLLGELRDAARQRGAVLFLASDHGFRWGEGRPAQLASAGAATAGRWHRDEGIYLLWGPGLAPGIPSITSIPSVPRASTRSAARPAHSNPTPARSALPRPRGSVSQVCATLLALLGLPPGRGLAGPPLPGTPGAPGGEPAAGGARPEAPAGPIDYGAYFHRPARPAPTASVANSAAPASAQDREKLAQLRALGYIGGGEPERATAPVAAGRGQERAAAGTAEDPTRTAQSFNNEGLLLRESGRTAEARAAFSLALARDPGLASARWNLSDLLYSAGAAASPADLDRSDALLVEALAGGLPDGVERTLERAAAHGRAGAADRCLSLLDRAIAAHPGDARLWLRRGRYRLEQRRCDGAESDFARATDLAPSDPLAHASLGLARLCRGDEPGALAAFRRSLSLDPNQPELRRFLGPGAP